MAQEKDLGGRPEKLTPDLHARIVRLIEAGNYIETAAQACGVHKVTLYRWLKRGAREREARNGGKPAKRGEAKYMRFCNAVHDAVAQAEARDVATIALASRDAWQAAAWRLERKFPARWGRRTEHVVTPRAELEERGDAGALRTAARQLGLDQGALEAEYRAALGDSGEAPHREGANGSSRLLLDSDPEGGE